MKGIRQIFLGDRFYYGCIVLVLLFVCSFFFKVLFIPTVFLLIAFVLLSLVDSILLFSQFINLNVSRKHDKLLSLGDSNNIELILQNRSKIPLKIELREELPVQLQKRDFKLYTSLKPDQGKKVISYQLTPKERGVYNFGRTHAYIFSPLGMVQRKLSFNTGEDVEVFPSLIQMKKYELILNTDTRNFRGLKKIRRIGMSYEFEQIKTYVPGDDIRSINWKATSRQNELMVNQYEDERSQNIYCVLDKGRSMRMPFNEMSLLDYAVNSALVVSRVGLNKKDKVGLMSFDEQKLDWLPAQKKESQMRAIMQKLYTIEESVGEANYEMLFKAIKRQIPNRSLILLYTNFDTAYNLHNVLPLLRSISHRHLLVTVFFENTILSSYLNKEPDTLKDIYKKTIVGKLRLEKSEMISELRRFGIQTIFTAPQDLTINTINKYLELKARGLI